MSEPVPGRIEALDGYRGIAITVVLLRHLFGVPGTWAGVDIFFVLSGLLITTILRNERGHPDLWKVFYLRRVTRILPPFLILLAASAVLVPLNWSRLWPYYAFFGGNVAVIVLGNPAVGPLSVIWSLAVEEHFYFVWPVGVKFLTDRALTRILVGILVGEPILRVLSAHFISDWKPYYFLTPFRLDGLAFGALLAILLSEATATVRIERALTPSIVTACTACVIFFDVLHIHREDTLLFNAIGYSLIAITSGIFLAWFILRPQNLLTKAVAWAPLRFLGRISYGLYLYHSLMDIVMIRIARSFGYTHAIRVSFCLTLPVSIFLAWVSFEFIEKRCLEFGRRKAGAYRTAEGPLQTTP